MTKSPERISERKFSFTDPKVWIKIPIFLRRGRWPKPGERFLRLFEYYRKGGRVKRPPQQRGGSDRIIVSGKYPVTRRFRI